MSNDDDPKVITEGISPTFDSNGNPKCSKQCEQLVSGVCLLQGCAPFEFCYPEMTAIAKKAKASK